MYDYFAIHNKALSDKISEKLFLVECPIESCYVCGGFQLNFLAKKSSWRAVVVMRWPEVIYQEVNKSKLTDHFIKYRGREEVQ